MDARKIAEMDQARAEVADVFPKLWWALFDQCVQQGFTRQEALTLLVVYMRGMMGK